MTTEQIERSFAFILDQQAHFAAGMEELKEGQRHTDASLARAADIVARMSETQAIMADRQGATTEAQEAMAAAQSRMTETQVRLGEAQLRAETKIGDLAEAQRRTEEALAKTERSLNSLIRVVERQLPDDPRRENL